MRLSYVVSKHFALLGGLEESQIQQEVQGIHEVNQPLGKVASDLGASGGTIDTRHLHGDHSRR